MAQTLSTHVSNESVDESRGDNGAAEASSLDVIRQACVILEYGDLLVSGGDFAEAARENALRLARKDVGRFWKALSACGLVIQPENSVPVAKLTAGQRAAREERLYWRGLLPASQCKYYRVPEGVDE